MASFLDRCDRRIFPLERSYSHILEIATPLTCHIMAVSGNLSAILNLYQIVSMREIFALLISPKIALSAPNLLTAPVARDGIPYATLL